MTVTENLSTVSSKSESSEKGFLGIGLTFSVSNLFSHKMVSSKNQEEERKEHYIEQTPDIEKSPCPSFLG